MRKILLTVAACAATSAHAADVDFTYENFYRDADMGRARIVLKVKNNTPKPLTIFAECAFLNADKRALDTAVLIASNVAAKSHAYMDAWSAQIDGIEHADCRIVRYR